MGCGGSKQQDVATGNTVSSGKLSQKESATTKSNASSTTTYTSTAHDSLTSSIEKVEITNTNGSSEANEKPTTTTVANIANEEKLTANEMQNKYLLPRKDVELVEADAGSEGVDANVVGVDRVDELNKSETKAQEEEKEVVSLKNDEDGDSIGKHSSDFKEILSVEETEEGEVVITEKNIG